MDFLKMLIKRLKCILFGCQKDKPGNGGSGGGSAGGDDGLEDGPGHAPPIDRR